MRASEVLQDLHGANGLGFSHTVFFGTCRHKILDLLVICLESGTGVYVAMQVSGFAMLYFLPPVQESDFATLSVMLFSIPQTNHQAKV